MSDDTRMSELQRLCVTHDLKIWPEPFEAVLRGDKTAEFRDLRDRDITVGDSIRLCEWMPNRREYTGRSKVVVVTDITTGFGIPEGFGMLSFGTHRSTLSSRDARIAELEAALSVKQAAEYNVYERAVFDYLNEHDPDIVEKLMFQVDELAASKEVQP